MRVLGLVLSTGVPHIHGEMANLDATEGNVMQHKLKK